MIPTYLRRRKPGKKGMGWRARPVVLFLGSFFAWHGMAFDAGIRTPEVLSVDSVAESLISDRGSHMEFEATAYCDYGVTKSGVLTEPGIVAGDPNVLPLGSVIYLETPGFTGIYRVMDTGRLVKGRIVDLYIPDYDRAVEFGRKTVQVTVLRYGFPERGDSLSAD